MRVRELLKTAPLDAVCACLVLVVVVVLSLNGTLGQQAQSAEVAPATADVQKTLREGAVLRDVTGTFEPRGDRIHFIIAGGESMIALENLNLERVAEKLNLKEPLTWTVSGTVSEYRGRYYLSITKVLARRNHNIQAAVPADLRRALSK